MAGPHFPGSCQIGPLVPEDRCATAFRRHELGCRAWDRIAHWCRAGAAQRRWSRPGTSRFAHLHSHVAVGGHRSSHWRRTHVGRRDFRHHNAYRGRLLAVRKRRSWAHIRDCACLGGAAGRARHAVPCVCSRICRRSYDFNADFVSDARTWFWATSAATGEAARFATSVMAAHPDYWPETVRALMVPSAR